MIKKRLFVFLSMSLIFLCACAHVAQQSPEENLLARVQLEWQSKLEYDWGRVYDMSCGDFKAKMDRNMVLNASKIDVTAYNILEVSLPEPGMGISIVEYTVRQVGREINVKGKETWRLENGEWCLDLSAALAFPVSQ